MPLIMMVCRQLLHLAMVQVRHTASCLFNANRLFLVLFLFILIIFAFSLTLLSVINHYFQV